MSSRHLLDPELTDGLAKLPAFDQLSAETLTALRAQIHGLAHQQVATASSNNVLISEHFVPTADASHAVRVIVYMPASPQKLSPAYLHFHGGGFVMGTPEMRHASSIVLAAALGCVIVSVDYRLAPENPFPAGIEDGYTALTWLYTNASGLGIDPQRIAIGGESAGGGLAAALAQLARDRGKVPVCFQLLIYPMLDDRTAMPTYHHPYAGQFVWTKANNHFGWSALLGQEPGTENISSYAAPARAEDMNGLPPAFIAVGALDLFAEENLDYARRLIRSGVPTELHIYPGAFHAFEMIADASVTAIFKRDWQAALRKAFSA